MKKISGKALSLVLSLALVVSSFSTALASANTTHTVSGTLSDTDRDKIYVVSGQSADAQQVITNDLEGYIFGGNDKTLETADHKVNDAKILSVSHSSGDRLVKWYDASKDGYSSSIDADDNVGLKLRSSSVSGHEVLNILYKATYSEDDVDYTVKGSKTFDVYCYDKYQPVIGVKANVGAADYTSVGIDGDANGAKKTAELTDDLAQKVVSHNGLKDSGEYKDLAVYVATPKGGTTEIEWQPITTYAKGDATSAQADVGYTIKVSNDSAVDMSGTTGTEVSAQVTGSSSGNITFTANLTSNAKKATLANAASWYTGTEDTTLEDLLSTTKDVTAKIKIAKKITVDTAGWTKLGKYSGATYLTTAGTSLDGDTTKASAMKAIKASGMEVKFAIPSIDANVTVTDKASVTKISGSVAAIDVSTTSSVDDIDLDAPTSSSVVPSIKISDAKVSAISFDDDGKGDVSIDSEKANVGDISNANDVDITSGKVGNVNAADEVDIKADDDTTATVVGDVKAKIVDIDSEDSKISVGTIKASDDSAEFTLNGSNVSVKGFDYDNRSSVNLKLDDFQGVIPAPVKAAEDGATLSTINSDANVEVSGDADIDAVSIEDASTIKFDGKLNVTSVDGSGTLVVGAGKMYIDGSVSGTTLKLSDSSFTKGTVAFTALEDCVEPDDFTGFGFTLAKTSGTKTDTFKVDTVVFKGLSNNKTSSEIAKGYSETFTAGSYPGGMSLPVGYTVQWSLEDANDQVFSLTTNSDGTATVKVVGVDTAFASENKATLKSELVDENGDTNDDYTAGETSLTALAVPAVNYKSDTTGDVKMNVGGTYQFKITSLDGTVPAFGLGSTIAAVTSNSKSGNDYFYKVTAKQAGDVGVYVNNTRVAILRISAASAKIDTTSVKIKVGGTYQFKVTSATKPAFGFGSSALQTVSTSNQGQDYFYKVKAVSGKTGDQVGVYVNGSRAAIVTIG